MLNMLAMDPEYMIHIILCTKNAKFIRWMPFILVCNLRKAIKTAECESVCILNYSNTDYEVCRYYAHMHKPFHYMCNPFTAIQYSVCLLPWFIPGE